MPLGLYISVPFCRMKCSYCNFSSGVFSQDLYERYVEQLCADVTRAPRTAQQMQGQFESAVDSIYIGGGTPTMLPVPEIERLFSCVRENFDVAPDAEITVEAAPGSLGQTIVEALVRGGVNRISLGVQSMVDREARAVGRLHTLETVVGDVARLRASGLENINVDLIAGLPHQTAASWKFSLGQILELAVPHVSVYMLEVDEDSRLGRELLAGGQRYHAHFVPDEDSVTEFYVKACDVLNGAGVEQYEISNFARSGAGSRHNLKYWTRQPYLGFGVDAHSMLKISPESSAAAEFESVRFSTPDSLDGFLSNQPMQRTGVSWKAAREEWFFLGLRLNCGVCLEEMPLGVDDAIHATVSELQADRLLERQGSRIFLTERGRLLSNEVFERFLEAKEPIVA